jgi:hypothetical protein
MQEIYKKVENFSDYSVSNKGNVISHKNGLNKKLSPYKNKSRGYVYISLQQSGIRKNFQLHRLVATHFISNLENKAQVNHKDLNKENNSCKNLEWVTHSENIIHSFKFGNRNKPLGNRKFTDAEVDNVFHLRELGMKHKEIAKKLGMAISTVTHYLLKTRRN